MSEESSLVELESSLETDTDCSDASDVETSATLRFQGQSDSEAENNKKPTKWQFWKQRGSHPPLSVQSGDVTRPSNTPGEEGNLLGCSFFTKAKKFIATIITWVLKVIFFHEIIPVFSVCTVVMNMVICAILIWAAIKRYPPNINISLRSFTIPNHPSQEHWDELSAAKAQRYINVSSPTLQPTQLNKEFKRDLGKVFKRSVGAGSCTSLPGQHQRLSMQKYTTWNLDLVYKIRDGIQDTNLLTKERLSQIHMIENRIYNSTGYRNVCPKTSFSSRCDLLTSAINSLYPTNPDGSFVFNTSDGFTSNLNASLWTFTRNPEQAVWYTGGQFSIVKPTNQIKATLLRSQISVGLPLPCYDSLTYDNLQAQKDAVWDYYRSLVPFFEEASQGEIEVLYGGTALYDYQVDNAERHDAMLALPSAVLIFVVVFILSGFSVWLTLLGLYSVFSCFPWAYFVYRVVLGIEDLNVLNIVSLFVVIGIGVDDVFVFINTFKHSAKLTSLPRLYQRLGYTILTAGKATFVTSLTTSVAFFANAITSIPAVRQFGIFMGLVVICCYIQVLVILPPSLHIWQSVFRYCENFCYYPLSLLFAPKPLDTPHVRLSELEDREIGMEREDSETGNEDSPDLTNPDENRILIPDSVSTQYRDLVSLPDSEDHTTPIDEDDQPLNLNSQPIQRDTDLLTRNNSDTKRKSAVDLLTSSLQLVMLYCIVWPLISLGKLKLPIKNTLCVWVYSGTLILSLGLVAGLLKFSDRPPQLFNSNTNIQKLLDLTGNLSEIGALDCLNGCGETLPHFVPTTVGPTTSPRSTQMPSHFTIPPSTPLHFTTPPTLPSHITTHPTKPPPAPPQTQPTTRAPHTLPGTRAPSGTHSPLGTTHAPGQPPTQSPQTTLPPPVTTGGGSQVTLPPGGNGEENSYISSLHSGNIMVNVVFGIKGLQRVVSSGFLPNGDYAIQDDSFIGNFTCNQKPANTIDLTGSIRALCRICSNISNPDNGLIMEGNYNCLPSSLFSPSFSCLRSIALKVPECLPLLTQDTSNVSVIAEAGIHYNRTTGTSNVQFVAMAFRSTTNPNDSPSSSLKDYKKWDDFLTKELTEISHQSGPGERYEGASESLSSGFQTAEKWVEINIEALAINGSLYGICVSVVLCMIIIAFLTHNWRVFIAIKLTVLLIIFSLLSFFVMFGWKLGIVEAITLTIVVGNSLDYCIHLCEGYMAATPEHIAYVEQFKFMSGASMRSKRVAASISFVGVSTVSSAVTTILAAVPMLFTTIQLFTRFGQILLLNTLLSILYTLVFCSTFLALFGPSDSKFTKMRALNALLTISTTVIIYPLLLFLLLYILSTAGIPILTADGSPLF